MYVSIKPDHCTHFADVSGASVTFWEGGKSRASVEFYGSLVPCAGDLATVFDIHHHAQDRRPLLEAAMLALDTPSQAHLSALIKAAQDMQAELAEAANG